MDTLYRQCCATVRSWWLHTKVVERTDRWVDVAVWTRWSKLTICFDRRGYRDEEDMCDIARDMYFSAACQLLYQHRQAGKTGMPALPQGIVNDDWEGYWTAWDLAHPAQRGIPADYDLVDEQDKEAD